MKGRRSSTPRWRSALGLVALLVLPASATAMEGKLGANLLRLVPSGTDAKRYSSPGWGGGIQLTVPMPQVANMLAGVIGFEYVNLLSEVTTTHDPQTLLRLE